MDIELRTLAIRSANGSTLKNAVDKSISAKAATNPDSVNLTPTAAHMLKAKEALASVPAVNAEHVAAVANAIQNAEYQIDDKHTADKFIALEKQLI